MLGIVGFALFLLLAWIPAIILGYQAKKEIDRSGGSITGRGLATSGIVLGWVGLAETVYLALAIIYS